MYFDFYFIHLIQNYSKLHKKHFHLFSDTLMFLTWFVTHLQHVLLTPHCQWTEWKCLGLWWGQPRLVTVLYRLRCADFRGCLLPWNTLGQVQRSLSEILEQAFSCTRNSQQKVETRLTMVDPGGSLCTFMCSSCVLCWDTIKFTVSNNSYQN